MKRIAATLSLGLALLLLTACAVDARRALTAQPMSPDEAFASLGHGDEPPDAAMKKAIFNASYEEVFRAASASTSQAQFEIGREDKHHGLILAKRYVKYQGITVSWGTESTSFTYFYAIRLKELGAKSTEVTISAKKQVQSCVLYDLDKIGPAMRLLSPPTDQVEKDNEYCRRLLAGMWSMDSETELSQFMIFVRNNLLAAGVM